MQGIYLLNLRNIGTISAKLSQNRGDLFPPRSTAVRAAIEDQTVKWNRIDMFKTCYRTIFSLAGDSCKVTPGSRPDVPDQLGVPGRHQGQPGGKHEEIFSHNQYDQVQGARS